MTATQDDTIAELQRTIAELRRERDAAQARRNSEYGERIEQQSATIDVLKVMSASPGDPQPVFDQIVRRARDLCDGTLSALYEYDGALVHLRGFHGAATTAAAAARDYAALFPMTPTRGSIMPAAPSWTGKSSISRDYAGGSRPASGGAGPWPRVASDDPLYARRNGARRDLARSRGSAAASPTARSNC